MSGTINSGVICKKRVVLAVTNDLVTDNRVNKIALSLLEMGFEITLCGRDYPSGEAPLNRPYNTYRFSLWFNKGPLFYACYNIRLLFYLIFNQFEVIVSNDLDTLLACYIASKIKRSQLVYDSHEYYTEVPELVDRPIIKRCWENIEKAILPDLKHCYTVSQSIAGAYKEKYGIEFNVIRNLPNYHTNEIKVEEFTPPFPTNYPVIIYQGAVNLGRGIEEAILAMHKLKDVNLVIIGIGDQYEKCKSLVNDEKLNARVFFLGRIEPEQLNKITKFASIGISVEKDMGLNYRFALPNKLFDYIQAEVPVLSSSLPEMKRVVKDYKVGLTIEEITPEAIASGITEMLESGERYSEWKENCKNAKKVLCWENEKITLEKIYRFFL